MQQAGKEEVCARLSKGGQLHPYLKRRPLTLDNYFQKEDPKQLKEWWLHWQQQRKKLQERREHKRQQQQKATEEARQQRKRRQMEQQRIQRIRE